MNSPSFTPTLFYHLLLSNFFLFLLTFSDVHAQNVCLDKRCLFAPGYDAAFCSASTKPLAYCPCKTGWTGEFCDQCLSGVGGNNCEKCLVGYSPQTYPNCKACFCNTFGSDSCEVAGPNKQCGCKTGFTGSSCDKCTSILLSFPSCDGGFVIRNIEILFLACGLAAAGILWFFFLRCCFSRSRNRLLIFLYVAILKLAFDIWFLIYHRKDLNNIFFLGCLLAMCLAWLFNLVSAIGLLIIEISYNAPFSFWCRSNFFISSITFLLSLSAGVEFMLFIQSRIFKWQFLCAPYQATTSKLIRTMGFFSFLIATVPLIGLEIWIINHIVGNQRDPSLFLSLFFNVLLCLCNLLAAFYDIIGVFSRNSKVIANDQQERRHSRYRRYRQSGNRSISRISASSQGSSPGRHGDIETGTTTNKRTSSYRVKSESNQSIANNSTSLKQTPSLPGFQNTREIGSSGGSSG